MRALKKSIEKYLLKGENLIININCIKHIKYKKIPKASTDYTFKFNMKYLKNGKNFSNLIKKILQLKLFLRINEIQGSFLRKILTLAKF